MPVVEETPEDGDTSLGLVFRARTARIMSLISDLGMLDVIREVSLEGAPRSVIEGLSLLNRSPYTLTKTLYTLWDMAVAMRKIRPHWIASREYRLPEEVVKGAAEGVHEVLPTRGRGGTNTEGEDGR